MNTSHLRYLSLIDKSISRDYEALLKQKGSTWENSSSFNAWLLYYKAFCFVTERSYFSALKYLKNENWLNFHFKNFIGFIYCCMQTNFRIRYKAFRLSRQLFIQISEHGNCGFENIKAHTAKCSADITHCMTLFEKLRVDPAKIRYLQGWVVNTKENKDVFLHLDMLYVSYGEDTTNKIFTAISSYAKTQRTTTLKTVVKLFKNLFNGLVSIYGHNKEISFEQLLAPNQAHKSFHNVYRVLFARSQASSHCPKQFHKDWAATVNAYTKCFIDNKVYSSPNKPFIVPQWKEPQSTVPSFSIGGSISAKERERWFSEIPLRVSDESTVKVIQDRLERDLNHIKHVCTVKFEEFCKREARNLKYIELGNVKSLDFTSTEKAPPVDVGPSNLKNTIATFHQHGIGAVNCYLHHLGYKSQSKQLLSELNLPTTSTLNVLLTLLIIEHPEITPAWLEKWTLYDKNANRVGYKQVGDQFVIVSYKLRRGSQKAQQQIVLNKSSKKIVEFLIRHTSFARRYLKENGNSNWRKMILTATISGAKKPSNLNTSLHSSTEFYGWLKDIKYFSEKSNITQKDAEYIATVHSLRSVRRHRGFQVYLEERSLDSVAEALGHEEKSLRLLSFYLPEPLIDYFNDRWIRQFQNAILLEAMKDSNYKFEAIDINASEIKEFLANHGISGFSNYFSGEKNESLIPKFDQLTYTISLPLLQLLIGIRAAVEEDDGTSNFIDTAQIWYQSALFIIKSLESERYGADKELKELFEEAKKNKLNSKIIKKALLC